MEEGPCVGMFPIGAKPAKDRAAIERQTLAKWQVIFPAKLSLLLSYSHREAFSAAESGTGPASWPVSFTSRWVDLPVRRKARALFRI
jgi:hypothetical protein